MKKYLQRLFSWLRWNEQSEREARVRLTDEEVHRVIRSLFQSDGAHTAHGVSNERIKKLFSF